MAKTYSRLAVVAILLLPMVLSCSKKETATESYDRGVEALEKEDYDLAITCFTEAIRLDGEPERGSTPKGETLC